MILRTLLVVLTLWPACFAEASTCVHDASTFRCVRALRNYDGDTITVEIPDVHPLLGEAVSVRIAGIDTPEIKGKGKCEKEAARAARELVSSVLKSAESIELANVQRDKYFRILADVIVDGRDLKTALLKRRLAYPYEGGTKEQMDWCKFSQGGE